MEECAIESFNYRLRPYYSRRDDMGSKNISLKNDGSKIEVGKKIITVGIAIILLLIFFISTRDYEKFKLLNKESEIMDPDTDRIVQATKECNKITNKTYKERCYSGISFSAGYNNYENYSELCPKLSNRGTCYDGASKRIGEEFYENLDIMFEKCEEDKNNEERCKNRAVRSAAKILTYHNQSFEYCETIKDNYKPWCYAGISWGLGNQHYPESKEQLISNCRLLEEPYKISCVYGFAQAAAEYSAKNPSYAGIVNQPLRSLTKLLSINQTKDLFDMAGFYSGIAHFKEQEVALSICDDLSKGLGEEMKTICYENVFVGVGYSYHSILVSKQ